MKEAKIGPRQRNRIGFIRLFDLVNEHSRAAVKSADTEIMGVTRLPRSL